MSRLDATSWSLIRRAAAGDPADRDAFAKRYAPVVRSFFCARWKLPLDHYQVEDAAQEVFLECFKENGVLQRADPERGTAFRSFFYGVARRVAGRVEQRISSRRDGGWRSSSSRAIVTIGADDFFARRALPVP